MRRSSSVLSFFFYMQEVNRTIKRRTKIMHQQQLQSAPAPPELPPYNPPLPEPPQESVRYVEVPIVKEEVIRVPKKEIYEYEKVVPVYDYEVREKVVEVPQFETVNTDVEVRPDSIAGDMAG